MDTIVFNNNMYTFTEFIDSINDDKITLEELKNCLTYQLMKEYGHYILSHYGSQIYDSIEFEITQNYIKKASKEDIEKIISFHLLKNHKDTLVNVFGYDFFVKISEGYTF